MVAALSPRQTAGNPLPDRVLQMSIVGVYFAGLDTVAGTMTCALYAAHKFPGVLERVMDDVNALFARPLEEIDRMTLKKSQALYGFILEVLRMFPIAPVTPRVAAETFEFAGYTIPGAYLPGGRDCREPVDDDNGDHFAHGDPRA